MLYTILRFIFPCCFPRSSPILFDESNGRRSRSSSNEDSIIPYTYTYSDTIKHRPSYYID